jgi:hypothetical protein
MVYWLFIPCNGANLPFKRVEKLRKIIDFIPKGGIGSFTLIYCKRIRGSSKPYVISASILMITSIMEMISTAPMIMGKS